MHGHQMVCGWILLWWFFSGRERQPGLGCALTLWAQNRLRSSWRSHSLQVRGEGACPGASTLYPARQFAALTDE